MDNDKCSKCGGSYDRSRTFPLVGGFGREVNEEFTRRRTSGQFDVCDHCLIRLVLTDRDRAEAAANDESSTSDPAVTE